VTPTDAERLYRLLSPALRRHCLRLAGNPTDAEDLVQEAFAALIRRGGPVVADDAARMLATCARKQSGRGANCPSPTKWEREGPVAQATGG